MPVFLSGVSTALPQYAYSQLAILEFMLQNAPEDSLVKRSLSAIYHHSGIQNRYSVLADFKAGNGDFFSRPMPPSTKERMLVYSNEAFELGKQVIDRIAKNMEKEDQSISSITHLVWVSCTGMVSPGVETMLLQSFNFQKNIQTTAFNFLGCHGFFHALRYADGVVKGNAKARVLIVCGELCTLHFQPLWHTDQLLANAIFGDAAAGLVVTSAPFGANSVEIMQQSQAYFHEKADAMSWNLGETGFDMRLSQDLPTHLEHVARQALDTLLELTAYSKEEVRHWLFHPGGKRILDRLEQTMELQSSDLKASRKALEMVGNVSSASVLFVLEQFFKNNPEPKNQPGVLLGVGPGLALETALFHY